MEQVSVSDGLSDANSKNSERGKNKSFKSQKQGLLKREQECSETIGSN